MKKVLIITYAFPPFGGGEVMRAAKFVKYLPLFGWLPVVLTVENQDYYVYDRTLLDEIDERVKIYRARTLEPKLLAKRVKDFIRRGRAGGPHAEIEIASTNGVIYRIGQLKNALSGAFLIPCEEVLWNPLAYRAACDIIAKEGIDLVFTTSPPHSTQLIGRRLKERFGLPWVADFRDAWVGNILFKPAYSLRDKIERRMESSVVKNADAVVSVTDPITKMFAARYPHIRNKFVTITNGFDGACYVNSKKPRNDKFTITYAGGIGGRRSSKYIFMALVQLKKTRPDVYSNLRVRFMGNFYDDKAPWKGALGDCVEFIAHKPYTEAVAMMQASDALLLVLHQREGGDALSTGKIYEYIGARRPIIATVPECVAKNLIVSNKLGVAVQTEDVDAIVSAIAEIYGRFKDGSLGIDMPDRLIDAYDRKNLTSALAATFAGCSGT